MASEIQIFFFFFFIVQPSPFRWQHNHDKVGIKTKEIFFIGKNVFLTVTEKRINWHLFFNKDAFKQILLSVKSLYASHFKNIQTNN